MKDMRSSLSRKGWRIGVSQKLGRGFTTIPRATAHCRHKVIRANESRALAPAPAIPTNAARLRKRQPDAANFKRWRNYHETLLRFCLRCHQPASTRHPSLRSTQAVGRKGDHLQPHRSTEVRKL